MYPLPMSDQIILAWTVDVAGSSFGPAQASAKLSAVPLYVNATTDPVLGQFFGLTVDADVTTTDATSATRTLTLNMNGSNSPAAPPPFPCHPITSTPPVLPYPLRSTKTLAGSFYVSLGSMSVPTTASQQPSLSIGDVIQFLSQPGVFYAVTAVSSTTIAITPAYSGATTNTGAYKEVAAPATITAVYSTSPLDTAAGPGARTVTITYDDTPGNGPFSTTVTLDGKRPAAVSLAMGSVDIAEITGMVIASAGSFGNSVGQLTLAELSGALPPIPSNTTPEKRTALVDEAQMLIARHLVYLPNSYFAMAQQGTSFPQLAGDFIVTTGSKDVPTTEDQSSVLSQGSVIQFAAQFENHFPFGTVPVLYVVAAVTKKIVTLTEVFTGIGPMNTNPQSGAGVKGTKSDQLLKFPTAAFFVTPAAAAPPSKDQLAGPLAQYVETQVAAPPPAPPLSPSTVPVPTFLSNLFTRTIALALAGVPVTAQTITFA